MSQESVAVLIELHSSSKERKMLQFHVLDMIWQLAVIAIHQFPISWLEWTVCERHHV